MKILIVAATWMEVKMLVDEMAKVNERSHLLKEYQLGEYFVDILITGIGTTFTAFHLSNALHEKNYQMVLNVGIAGSLTHELKIGEVVNVASDEFADLGIEKEDDFLTLFDSGFLNNNDFPFEGGILKASSGNGWLSLKKVRGLTVNKSSGRKSNIDEIKAKFSAHVESMEGAAVLFVCRWLGVDCYQLRAISNYVEPRDTAEWNIPQALENLKTEVLAALRNITVSIN
jgi:futalosine hydrolase